MADAAPPILHLRQVVKDYGEGEARQRVLHGVDLEVRRTDFAALIGPSGSGKSTLLNILGLLDRATSGSLQAQGQETSEVDDDDRTALRRRTLGFVFQFHHLLPAFNAVENVLMPIRIERRPTSEDKAWALELLRSVGLAEKAKQPVTELSGGQQQRVAIARALAMRPAMVLADEPTGNLDTESGAQAFALLRRMHDDLQVGFLIVTHDPRIAAQCARVIEIVDGRIRSDVRR